jgi:hypothetical protein
MSDLRKKTIRLAHSLPAGSSERKALLEVLAASSKLAVDKSLQDRLSDTLSAWLGEVGAHLKRVAPKEWGLRPKVGTWAILTVQGVDRSLRVFFPGATYGEVVVEVEVSGFKRDGRPVVISMSPESFAEHVALPALRGEK